MAFLFTGLKNLLFGNEKTFLATVAIDLGAVSSGFAFSFGNNEQSEQGGDSTIFMNRDWVNELGHQTSKTPTCLLLKPDQSFDSFGYEAEERYAYLRSVYEGQDEFLFFQLFKIALYNDKKKNKSGGKAVKVNKKNDEVSEDDEDISEGESTDDDDDDEVVEEDESVEDDSGLGDEEHDDESYEILDLESTLEASNGKTVRAMTVFAHCIRFLRHEAVEIIRQETGEDGCDVNDIQWVLTVPVMWAARSKQFMREAAYEAGIGSRGNPGQVMIVNEAEAAALFCIKTEIKDAPSQTGAVTLGEANAKFILVDIGGGSLDMTAYEQHDDGTINEIYKATGGSYGAVRMISRQFEHLLDDLFGVQKLYEYRKMFPSDWLNIMEAFEAKKRAFQNEETVIRMPGSFVSWVNDFRHPSMKRYGAGDVKILDDEYLCLGPSIMLRLFQPFIKAVKHQFRAFVSKPKLSKITTLYLVGGYADSLLLQEEMKKEFSDTHCVIASRDSTLAVVKGAVIVAHMIAGSKERVASTTYGVDCSRPFVRGEHPEEKKFLASGKERCKDLFNCFVKENGTVKHGQKVSIRYRPRKADETEIRYTFYAATTPDVIFVTDPGVTEIGSVVVHSPDTRQGLDRDILVSMYFGGTEIIATAWDVSSWNRAQTTLDVSFSCSSKNV